MMERRGSSGMAAVGVVSALLATPWSAHANDFHVSASAAASGDGSEARPWRLQTALAQPSAVHPGDTIWVHGGTYRGTFASTLNGTAAAPIVVRAVPGERATLDGGDSTGRVVLLISGDYSWFWGLEVMSSDPVRVTTETGSWPALPRGEGINVGNNPGEGQGTRIINCVVHDTRQGLSLWRYAVDMEAYGNLVYHNGWNAPDRGHGHGGYIQNELAPARRIEDNVMFGGFGYGIQAYGSETAFIDHLSFVGNVIFRTGVLSGGGSDPLLVGGGRPSRDITVRNNVIYGGKLQLGYATVVAPNEDAIVEDNVLGGFAVRNFRSVTARRNRIVTSGRLVGIEHEMLGALPTYTWDANTYRKPMPEWESFYLAGPSGGAGLEWDAWRTRTSFDSTSTYARTAPERNEIVVRANRYERGRAHIAVLNWTRAASVDVDVSSVLPDGTRFVLRDAQDFYGTPVLSGVVTGGRITVPMTAREPVQPIGDVPHRYLSTGPEFGVFVLFGDVAPGSMGEPDAGLSAATDAGAPMTVTDAGLRQDAGGAVHRTDAGSAQDAAHVDGGRRAESDAGRRPGGDEPPTEASGSCTVSLAAGTGAQRPNSLAWLFAAAALLGMRKRGTPRPDLPSK